MKLMTCKVTWADHGPGPSCPAGAKCSDPPRPPLPDQSIPFPGKHRILCTVLLTPIIPNVKQVKNQQRQGYVVRYVHTIHVPYLPYKKMQRKC